MKQIVFSIWILLVQGISLSAQEQDPERDPDDKQGAALQ